jgi:hypothetical protein
MTADSKVIDRVNLGIHERMLTVACQVLLYAVDDINSHDVLR